MFCPLKFKNELPESSGIPLHYAPWSCEEEKCGWWDNDQKTCSALNISKALEAIWVKMIG